MKKSILFLLFSVMTFLGFAQDNNIRMASYYDSKDEQAYYIVWNMKTGANIQYYWNGDDHKWDAMEINLPQTPITGALGNIMIRPYYDENDGDAYYVVWDTKTGRSVTYFWNGDDYKWSSFEINLPADPIPGHLGEVGCDVYYDYNDQQAYYIFYDMKTGKSIQYYWNGDDHKWDAMQINLPENPLH